MSRDRLVAASAAVFLLAAGLALSRGRRAAPPPALPTLSLPAPVQDPPPRPAVEARASRLPFAEETPRPSGLQAFSEAPELSKGGDGELVPLADEPPPPAPQGPAPDALPSAGVQQAGECLISHRFGQGSRARSGVLTVTVDGKRHGRHVFSAAQMAAGEVTWIRISDDTRDHRVAMETLTQMEDGSTSLSRTTFVGRGLGTWRTPERAKTCIWRRGQSRFAACGF